MSIRITLLFVLMMVALRANCQTLNSWQDVKQKGSGTISVVYFESPGLIYNQNNQLKGLCVELINDFVKYVDVSYGKKLSVNFYKNEKDFSEFLKTVQYTKNVLGVSAVTITESRKAYFDYTPPFLSSPNVLITNKSAASIASLKDLKNYTPVCLASGSQTEMIKQIQKKYITEAKLNYFNSPTEILENINSDVKSFTILGLNDFLDATRKKMKIRMQKLKLGNPEIFGFIMPKNSDWSPVWYEFLTDKYINSPTYKNMIARNLGSVFLDSDEYFAQQ